MIVIVMIIMHFNLSQTYFKGPGFAMFRLLLRTGFCILLKVSLQLSSPTYAFTLSLSPFEYPLGYCLLNSKRPGLLLFLYLAIFFLLLSVVLSLSTILASTVFAHDCLLRQGAGWGSGRVRKVTCLAKPRWPPPVVPVCHMASDDFTEK